MEQVERIAPDFKRLENVVQPDPLLVSDDRFCLEVVSNDGIDGIYHLFAVPDYHGPWDPPEGTVWIRDTLQLFRERANLPYKQDTPWCVVDWDKEGLPELVHYAVRRIEDVVQQWLLSLDIKPDRITANGLLNKMQDILSKGAGTWFSRRLSLLGRLQSQTLRQLLADLGQPLPEGEDVDEELHKYLEMLFPLRPGMWCLRFQEMNKYAVDRKALAELFLQCLS